MACRKEWKCSTATVTVQVSSWWVTPSAIVFEMEPY
jgi:hypothetical protein